VYGPDEEGYSGWNPRLNWRILSTFKGTIESYRKQYLRGITMITKPLEKTFPEVEVTVIASHGMWLKVRDREVFMSYDDFPWFKDAPIGKVLNVEEPNPGHLYWPDLDVVVGIKTI